MKIALDGRALTGRYTGDRTYWLGLVRGLAALAPDGMEFAIYSRLPLPDDALPAGWTSNVLPAPNDRWWTLRTLPQALRKDGSHLLHTQYTTPIGCCVPVITTIHDISFHLHPEWFPTKHRILLNLTVPDSARRSAHVITDSESSRADILKSFRLADSRVTAIHLAAGSEFVPIAQEAARQTVADRHGFSSPYFVSVSVVQPRKNFGLLLDAIAHFAKECDLPHRLLITGKEGWGTDELTAKAKLLGIADRLTFTGYVPDEDLPILYAGATASLYPSFYEGFGLPPLESMSVGTPTLVSDAPCMPEVAGEGAWVLPVNNPVAWSNAMRIVASHTDEHAKWSKAGLKRAEDFSWKRTAEETVRVYQAVLSQ